MQTIVLFVKEQERNGEILTERSEKSMNHPRIKTKRFAIQRTVTSGKGISAYMELSAVDVADAEQKANALFAHEESTATYAVRRLVV